jgi:hypothetical protein
VVLVTLVHVVVDARHQGDIDIVRRGANQHLARPALEMAGGIRAAAKGARGFDDDIHTRLPPGNLGRIAFRAKSDGLTIDLNRLLVMSDVPRKTTVYRVVFEQIGEIANIGQIVDGDNVHVRQRQGVA